MANLAALVRDKPTAVKQLDEEDMKFLTSSYQLHEILGSGAYGVVLRATQLETGMQCAIKKILLEHKTNGVPATTIREITFLYDLRKYPGVVSLLDVLCAPRRVYLVFELAESDLRKYIHTWPCPPKQGGSVVPIETVRRFTYEMIYALACCHNSRILHRDLKPSNILLATDHITAEPRIMLADFGLSRTYEMSVATYTTNVMTLWYRSPEILLGDSHYSASSDLWSIGCIVLEMVMGNSVFRGRDETTQLQSICSILGSPTVEEWPEVAQLERFAALPVYPARSIISGVGKGYNAEAISFAAEMLVFNPAKRPSAATLLAHPFLRGVVR